MKATEIITTLYRRDRVLIGLGFALLNILAGIAFNMPVSFVFAALALFTCFDAYGYFYLTQCCTYGSEDIIKKATYRICQNMVFVLLITILVLIAGWTAAAMFVLAWWLGFCDYHYYWVLKQMDYMQGCEDMPWLWWTPYGFILRRLKKPVHSGYLTGFTYISIIILFIYGLF